MYEQHFGFNRTPFRLEPEPDMCFSGKGYVEAFSCLTNAIQDYQGIIILSGFPGTGKTSLVRKATEAAISPGTTICRINRANIADVEKTLEVELNNRWQLSAHGQATGLSVEQILLASAEQDKHILIIIDEAQRLSTEDINFLVKLVSENRSVMSFFKIILVGHEKLDEFFNLDDLRKQHQLTFVHCELTPLEVHEIKPYVMHRLEKGGWSGKPSFDDAIYGFVYQVTKGIPLRVNSFFDRLLLFVYLEGKEIVDYSILKKFSEELLEEIQLEKSLDVDVYDLQQALNHDDDKPNAAQAHDKKTSPEEKVVGIAEKTQSLPEKKVVGIAAKTQPLPEKKSVDITAKTQPLLESAGNDLVVQDSRFAHIKKWLAVLVSLILVLILVSFIFSKNSDQQALLSTDNNVLLSGNLKKEIEQPASAVKQTQSVAIAEKELDEPNDTIVSSEFVESTSELSESATLGWVLPEEPAFDEDDVVGQPPPVTSSHAEQAVIDDSLLTDTVEFSNKNKQSAVLEAAGLAKAQSEQKNQPRVNQTDEPEKTEEVINEIAATHLDSHKVLDIDPPDPSQASNVSEKTKSQKNVVQNTTEKEASPIKSEVNKPLKSTTETQEETEKIKISDSQQAIAENTSQATTLPRKTHPASVSSEIELAKRNDLELMMIKRSVDRESPDRIVEPIEDIPISEGEEVVAPTDEDLKKLIAFLTQSYKTGELDEFSDLFVANAVSNGSFNRKQIRDDYESLFNSTDKRRIAIKDLIWTRNGLDALGIGTFEVFIFKKNSNEMERFHGEIVIEAQKQQTKTQIKKLFYRYNVAS